MTRFQIPKWLLGMGLLLLALAVAVPVLAQTDYELPRWVMGGGGGTFLGSGSYRLNGMLGQPVAGPVGAASGAGLCSGFWCRTGLVERGVYLPLVLRNS
jgi:hypothetical protein